MDCISPPELEDRKLLAYLDGEAEPSVGEHLARCPYCRRRADELQSIQSELTARLYRLDCPSSLELGEYRLGMLSTERTDTVGRHLRECRLCMEEYRTLQGYLHELAPSDAKHSPGGIQVLIARLVGARGGNHAAGVFSPAPVMLRGELSGPLTFEADGVLIMLDLEPVDDEKLVTLRGQIAAVDQDLWTGAQCDLGQDGQLHCIASVDDLGAFVCEAIAPGSYSLRLIPPEGPQILADLEIVI